VSNIFSKPELTRNMLKLKHSRTLHQWGVMERFLALRAVLLGLGKPKG
jgi:hypothetical protein